MILVGVFKELPDFFGIGVVSTLIDWGLFSLLIWFRANYLVAVTLSFVAGAVFNFYGNRGFTFQMKDKKGTRMFIFMVIAVSAWMVTVWLMKSVVVWLALVGVWLIAARMFVTIVVFIYNFFMHKYITFRRW